MLRLLRTEALLRVLDDTDLAYEIDGNGILIEDLTNPDETLRSLREMTEAVEI